MEPSLPLTVALHSSSAPPRSVSLHLHPPTEYHNHLYNFYFESTSHSIFVSLFIQVSFVPHLPSVNIVYGSCLLFLLLTHSFPQSLFHSFFLALCCVHTLSSPLSSLFNPLLGSHPTSVWHSQPVSRLIVSSLHPPSMLPFRFIFFFTDEWWEIWKCQRDQAGDQRGLF